MPGPTYLLAGASRTDTPLPQGVQHFRIPERIPKHFKHGIPGVGICQNPLKWPEMLHPLGEGGIHVAGTGQ